MNYIYESLLIILIIWIASIPIIIAVYRKHAYVWIIILLTIVSFAVGYISGPIPGIILWSIAFIWAAWPRRVGFISPFIDATSADIGKILDKHIRDCRRF